MKALVATVVVSILLVSSFLVTVQANPFSFPQSLPIVTIASDGSVIPQTNSISRVENTYFLSRNVSGNYSLRVLCNDIVFDGMGYSFVGGQFEKPTGIFINATNVTVRNIEISSFFTGIYISNSSRCLIENVTINYCYDALSLVSSNLNKVTNNTIRNMYQSNFNGIDLDLSFGNILCYNHLISNQYSIFILNCQNNIIFGNTIETSIIAVNLMKASIASDITPSNNYFYLNSFVNNSRQFSLMDLDVPPPIRQNATLTTGYFNYWNFDGYGNYWSDYSTKYPDAKEIDNSGIGDTPYVVAINNTDDHPLIRPLDVQLPEIPTITIPSPSPSPIHNPNSSSTQTPATSTVSPSDSPSPISPSPTAPEISWLIIPPLLLTILSSTVMLRLKKRSASHE